MVSDLDPSVRSRIQQWLDGPYDEKTKSEIRRLMKEDPAALTDAFYKDLSFGTAGLRDLMGVGTNRLNPYTIRMATQGLANYINKHVKGPKSVFIGFDSRHNSTIFAQQTAQVLAANGIQVLLLKELRPTPFISFGCRYKKCTAAVMITASHNPAEYNGYKVYWSDGGQIVPPHDTGIMAEVNAIKKIEDVKMADLHHPLIQIVDEKLDQAYYDAIRPLQHFPEVNKREGAKLKISYTSLNGCGITMSPIALKDWGFTNVNFVEAQIKPDGDFPTTKFPNPEFPETLKLGIEQLQKSHSNILIANDPDADRTGAVALHQGKPVILSGNEIASICVHYICETLKRQKKMSPKGAVVTTIVTTPLLKKITESYGETCFEVLTGFKYIGEKIHLWEGAKDGYQFLFGAEESLGFLIGTHARDKDAVVSTCLLSEIALQAKLQGKTLVDLLYAIYKEHGIFREKQDSLSFKPSKENMMKIQALIENLRKKPPDQIGGQKVTAIEDYESGVSQNLATGKKEKLTLPKSEVLLFRLADESRLVIRPSGTEPKIKFYAAAHTKTFSSIPDGIGSCDEKLEKLLKAAKSLCPA